MMKPRSALNEIFKVSYSFEYESMDAALMNEVAHKIQNFEHDLRTWLNTEINHDAPEEP